MAVVVRVPKSLSVNQPSCSRRVEAARGPTGGSGGVALVPGFPGGADTAVEERADAGHRLGSDGANVELVNRFLMHFSVRTSQ